jgi:hypothetical protein
LRYVQDGPAYELWLEEALNPDAKFDNKVEKLPQALHFYWKMKVNSKCRFTNQSK